MVAITSIVSIIYVKYCEQAEEKSIIHSNENMIEQEQLEDDNKEEEENKNVLSELKIVEVDMPDQIGDYKVLGEIEIPKIEIKQYILDYCNYESLDLAVAKFWGEAGIHGAGNFSIIGHNYQGIFRDLKKLEKDDTFIITDKQGKQCTYVIYDSYIVEPDDVSCIEDTLEGKREVTLITCVTGGKKRLILKAKEQI